MEWLNYLLKVSVCLTFFFAFYLLVLKKLTFFKVNRIYLLASLLLSFLIPALQFTIERVGPQVLVAETPIAVQDVDLGGAVWQAPIQVGNGQTDLEYENFDWYAVLSYAYGTIVAILLSLAIWRLIQLLKHTNKNVKELNGLKIVPKTKGFTNCSFFNYVFVDPDKLTGSELNVLLRHEEVHAKQLHSLDKIILMIAKAILWFNPIIYFYDKALEQTHEYEADEATSTDFGTNNYANLLLRLAVEGGQVAWVHNFVKSPIKDRIKMLFNNKSKTIKKLMYLLIIPIGLALTWGFTVDVVYTLPPQVQEPVQQDTSKVAKNRNQAKLQAEAYRKSPEYAAKLRAVSGLNGQTLKGKIGPDYIHREAIFSTGKLFMVGNKTYILADHGINNLKMLKVADEVEVKVEVSSFSKNVPYLVLNAQTIKKNNVVVYTKPPVKKEPFLFEANRARSAWTKIKSIERKTNGEISKIVLNDDSYTINLYLADQKFKNSAFKAGDRVLVKFFGEKLTGNKTYSTNKMIVLYSQPKKFELKNPSLYNRFYHEDGTQMISESKLYSSPENKGYTSDKNDRLSSNILPRLITSGNAEVNVKTGISYFKDGKLSIGGAVLEGKNLIYDQKKQTIFASKASIVKGGEMIVSEEIRVDLVSKQFRAKEIQGTFNLETLKLIAAAMPNHQKVVYNGSDSIRVNKKTGVVYLYGDAFIGNPKMKFKGSEIVYDSKSNSAEVKNATYYDNENEVTANTMKINFNTLKVVATGVLKGSFKN